MTYLNMVSMSRKWTPNMLGSVLLPRLMLAMPDFVLAVCFCNHP
jgi:hypothetical protein